MKTERIDGVDYEIGTPAHEAAVKRRDAAEAASRKQVADLTAQNEKLQAKADEATEENAKLKKQLAEATDPARLDAAASARADLVARAKKIAGSSFKADGLSNQEIMRAALKAAKPDLKLDGKTDGYVEARFDSAVELIGDGDGDDLVGEAARAATGVGQRGDEQPRTDEEDINPAAARAAMLERNRKNAPTKAKA